MQSPDPTPRPLDHLTLRGSATHPALQVKNAMVDFAELDQSVGRLAAALRASGLADGDRVASWLNKSLVACLLPLATARAGLVHVPVNPALKRAQVAHILADSGSRLFISGKGRLAALEDGDISPVCQIWTEDEAQLATQAGEYAPPSNQDPQSLCAILYTSGSTGKPKGVMLSHANLWLGAISVAQYLGLAPSDRTLCVLPLSFDYGQNQLLSTWAAGGCTVPFDYLNARDVIKAVAKYDITTLAGVPPLWVQLIEADWPSETARKLHRLTNSGGALTPPLVRRLRGLFGEAKLFAMYGLTEAFRSTFLDPALIDSHPTSIGCAIPFAEIMIVKPDGRAAAPNETGELVHAGPLVAKGYWQDAERTALRFKAAPDWSHHGGMAVWSGDTAMQDADGLLYFVGRDDEMIKTSGNRVSPAEIEEVAIASGVTNEAVAIGVPDEILGQSIALMVKGGGDQEDALQAYFRKELPAYLQPRRIIWRDELARNANGKLDRSGIKAEILAMEQGK